MMSRVLPLFLIYELCSLLDFGSKEHAVISLSFRLENIALGPH